LCSGNGKSEKSNNGQKRRWGKNWASEKSGKLAAEAVALKNVRLALAEKVLCAHTKCTTNAKSFCLSNAGLKASRPGSLTGSSSLPPSPVCPGWF